LFTVYCLLSTAVSLSQNPDIKRTWNWYFGNYAGLNFSTGNPVALTNSAMSDYTGCSSISDTAGNLLFYTDGVSVWNSNHQKMPNGTGLHGDPSQYVSQDGLIVPQPLSPKYYIFTIWQTPDSFRLKYSVVDMALNAGLGDVTIKNVFLTDKPTARLTAVKHANNTDIWVLNTDTNTNRFRAYLLTASGLQAPVISYAGRIDNVYAGIIKASPDGKKIAVSITLVGSEILDFDNLTGTVSNPILFPASSSHQDYGADFSPDNSKLYFTRKKYPPSPIYMVAQVDLSSGDSLTIANSFSIVDTFQAINMGQVQLASDGKVYFSQSFKPYLSAITNPNVAGIGCNVVDSVIWLGGGGRQAYDGLPNFVTSYFFDSSLISINNTPELQNEIICYPNPFKSYCYISFPQEQCDYSARIGIYNVLGSDVTNEFDVSAICNEQWKTMMRIYRKNIPEGIYLLKATVHNKVYSQKLVITD